MDWVREIWEMSKTKKCLLGDFFRLIISTLFKKNMTSSMEQAD